MLPQTPYAPSSSKAIVHEGINDLPVHQSTRQQVFVSAAESRQFSRADAARAFSNGLLPADKRIAHPELVQLTKWRMAGHSAEERTKLMRQMDERIAKRKKASESRLQRREVATTVVVPARRWDFKFLSFAAERLGKTEKSRGAVGLRYGLPHEDRKRAQVKIPTKVE